MQFCLRLAQQRLQSFVLGCELGLPRLVLLAFLSEGSGQAEQLFFQVLDAVDQKGRTESRGRMAGVGIGGPERGRSRRGAFLVPGVLQVGIVVREESARLFSHYY